MTLDQDPAVQQLRSEITANDLAIVAAINRRLGLAAQMKRLKLERGYRLIDEAREAAWLGELARANPGPLSEAGLRQIFGELLALSKRELAFEEEP